MKIIVWSKEDCQYCDMAKQLLTTKGIEYEEKKIGNGFTKEDLLNEVPSARSVPQILIDGVSIGGFKELQAYLTASESIQ